MKKIGMLVIGILIGIMLTLSPQIYGAGSKLLGSKVDNTLDIKLNGKSIGQGAVIEGTSYLPVRSAANALGLEISVDSKQVNLQGKSSSDLSKKADEEQQELINTENKANEITNLTAQIKLSKQNIASLENAIPYSEKTLTSRLNQLNAAKANSQISQEILDRAQSNYDDAVKAVETNKENLATEQHNLADLESQLAALQQK